MPPRKSTDNAEDTPTRGAKQKDGISVEDLTLPRSMIARLAKGVLPSNTQIQREALLALSKSATVFVNYLASSANDRAQLAGKKTIQPEDVRIALPELEFENFLPRCNAELAKYNEIQCDKRNSYRRRIKEEKAAAVRDEPGEGGDVDGEHTSSPRDRDGEPSAKRQRTSSFGGAHMNGRSQANGDDDDGDTIDGEEDEGEGYGDEDAELEEEDDVEDDEGESDGGGGRDNEDDDGDRMPLRAEEDEDDLDRGEESE